LRLAALCFKGFAFGCGRLLCGKRFWLWLATLCAKVLPVASARIALKVYDAGQRLSAEC